jgi:branched-chain amino acid aminotransferase
VAEEKRQQPDFRFTPRLLYGGAQRAVKVWFNGRLVDESRAHLSVFDHAFLYGDGLYETVRLEYGRIFLWHDHYRRLKKSAAALGFAFPWTLLSLEKAVKSVARANRKPAASARITLSRGTGPLGLDPALCPKPTLVIQLHPDRDLEQLRRDGVSVGLISPKRVNPIFKSVSMQSLVLARIEAKRLGVFEGLLLNARGELTEGITTNLFFMRKGILHTPALACGLLPGVTRAYLLSRARRLGIAVREGVYRPADLLKADELFLTNASIHIVPVTLLKMGKQKKTFHQRLLINRLLMAGRGQSPARTGRAPTRP